MPLVASVLYFEKLYKTQKLYKIIQTIFRNASEDLLLKTGLYNNRYIFVLIYKFTLYISVVVLSH